MFSRLSGDRPQKSHLVVKVVIESHQPENMYGLKVSSEDYSLHGYIIQKFTPRDEEELKNKIEKEGTKAGKGFFYAILPKDGKRKKGEWNVVEIKINTENIQPIESW